MEIGIGIHGEPGRERVKVAPVKDIARMLVDPILADLDYTGAPAVVMVNGMGATPLIELYGLYAEVVDYLREKGIEVVRNLVGNYITSLDMAGASVTIMRADEELLGYWDAPVVTPGLRWGK